MNQFLLLIVLFLLLLLVIQKKPKKERQNQIDYSTAYQAKYLLTQNEWHEYKKLKVLADEKQLQICPKVRLLDLIEPRSGDDGNCSVSLSQSSVIIRKGLRL